MDLPLGLKSALETGECVLFLGAGIGKNLHDPLGRSAPSGATLSEEIIEHFDIDTDNNLELSKIAAIVEIRKGRSELEAFLRKRLSNLQPDDSLKWLLSLRWRAIFTTNYDDGIERTYQIIGNPKQEAISISSTSRIVAYDSRFEVPIFHLHGCLFGSEKPHIIITEDDYARFQEQRRMLFEILKREFATSTILYIGYSNKDSNWKTVFSELISEFYPSTPPHSYRIAPDTDPFDREILKTKGIETIDGTLQELANIASTLLIDLEDDQDKLRKLKTTVPSDLIPAFEKNPAGVLRLLTSWTYVNQAPFQEEPNLYSFLRGDRPNWGLIGSRMIFERDIEDEIYDQLLDYVTGNSKVPTSIIILAPAGYGITTLIMTLAARLVKEGAGPVFMLKPGKSPYEGDIDFAASIFDQRPFFFVDNASDYSEFIYNASHILKDKKQTALFVLGERLNEWRQSRGRVFGKEFIVEPLSDNEINSLLDYLTIHSQLNALQSLRRDIQFSVIKEKHKRDLLVVLRESTEGKDFDAILEDEFRGIADEVSRKLYLIVCCFYQHGVYVRDSLLESLLGKPLNKIYELTSDATEGVVIFDQISHKEGEFVARARHRIIATVVWERCADPGEKERILQMSLSSLNLNYGLDKDAFEHFVRVDRIVDSVRSLEAKINFFDKASQKDPLSPYVRQHYARMLLREDKGELALGQIEEAIHLDPKIMVLYHTKGMILSYLAINNENLDLARRRLVQAEASFRHGLNIHPKDDYCYQGLAQLFLDWAKRCENSEEATTYIAKAEEIVNDGLKNVRVRDSLWIVSSNIQSWLGNQHSRVLALEKAVRESPGSIIARYLLARSYRKMEEYQKAIDLLDPIIKNYHDEFRSFVEYAVSLMMVKHTYSESIAILQLSTLYGFGDPRFIATYGGMLYMDERFTDASKVFAESHKHDFSSIELNTLQFRPVDFNNQNKALRLIGKIVAVKAGYAMVETSEYPSILCPGSKFNGLIMQPQMKISFEIAFCSKGAIADRPSQVE